MKTLKNQDYGHHVIVHKLGLLKNCPKNSENWEKMANSLQRELYYYNGYSKTK